MGHRGISTPEGDWHGLQLPLMARTVQDTYSLVARSVLWLLPASAEHGKALQVRQRLLALMNLGITFCWCDHLPANVQRRRKSSFGFADW